MSNKDPILILNTAIFIQRCLFPHLKWYCFYSVYYCYYLIMFVYAFVKPIVCMRLNNKIIIPPLSEGGGGILFYLCPSARPSFRPSVCPSVLPSFRPSVCPSVCPSVLPSFQDIFRRIFLSNCWWQKSDIWSQASYRYTILWVTFLDPSDSYFLFADFVDFYTHWTYMLIFRCIFLSHYWWQKSDIWSQASYRYAILWEAFLDPSDSYFLFADLVGFYTHWTYMHIFRHIFLSYYWWQRSNIWSQASYRYPILWEVFLDPSDSYLPKSGGIIGEH